MPASLQPAEFPRMRAARPGVLSTRSSHLPGPELAPSATESLGTRTRVRRPGPRRPRAPRSALTGRRTSTSRAPPRPQPRGRAARPRAGRRARPGSTPARRAPLHLPKLARREYREASCPLPKTEFSKTGNRTLNNTRDLEKQSKTTYSLVKVKYMVREGWSRAEVPRGSRTLKCRLSVLRNEEGTASQGNCWGQSVTVGR